MTDKTAKNLAKLSKKEQTWVKAVLEKLLSGDAKGLKITKLRGSEDIYRVKKGSIRIIFRRTDSGEIFILAIERRSKHTYKDY